MINGKPKKIMHYNGKQFTSRIFRHFLVHNQLNDKQIPNSCPQLQGRVEAYNETREHGGINGLTPSEMFLQRLITSSTYTRTKQKV